MRSASIFAKLVSPIDETMRLSCAQNTTSLRKSIKMSNKNLLIRIYRVAQDSSKSFTILIVSSVDHKSSSEMILCNFFYLMCAFQSDIVAIFLFSNYLCRRAMFFSMSRFWWQDIKRESIFSDKLFVEADQKPPNNPVVPKQSSFGCFASAQFSDCHTPDRKGCVRHSSAVARSLGS